MTLHERAVLTGVRGLVRMDGGQSVPVDAMTIYQETFGPSSEDKVLKHIQEIEHEQ